MPTNMALSPKAMRLGRLADVSLVARAGMRSTPSAESRRSRVTELTLLPIALACLILIRQQARLIRDVMTARKEQEASDE